MKILALVTCRGNNTLQDKHLRIVNGKKLIEYPLQEVKKCHAVDYFYISSDDDKILDIAAEYDYKIIKRPAELSEPTSKHVDAIIHALEIVKNQESFVPEIVVVCLGNTVYIKSEWIEESIRMIEENPSISAVVPAYLEQDLHPYRAKYLNEEGYLEGYFPALKNVSTNRQDLPQNFFLCHNFWTLNVKESIEKADVGQVPWTFMGNKIKPLVLDRHLDVHSESDIEECERWLKYS